MTNYFANNIILSTFHYFKILLITIVIIEMRQFKNHFQIQISVLHTQF